MTKAVDEALRLNDECYMLEQAFDVEREKRRTAKASGKNHDNTKLTAMKNELVELRLKARKANVAAGLRDEENTIKIVEE